MPNPTPHALNEALARHFGWRPYAGSEIYWVPPTGIPENWSVRDLTPPDYLTWEGMGVVLEEMREREWWCRILESDLVLRNKDEQGGVGWEVGFRYVGDAAVREVYGRGKLLPTATALAALAALEGEG